MTIPRIACILTLALFSMTTSLLAQDARRTDTSPQPAAGQAASPSEGFASLEGFLNQAVKNISAHYNLNSEQQALTQEIMSRRVKAFLRENYNEVWPVLEKVLKLQLSGGEGFTPEDLQQIGKAAAPLLEQIRAEIYEGNEEWRAYLTDDQKIRHDLDLKEMDETMGYLDSTLKGWSAGRIENKSLLPAPRPITGARPSKPAPGLPRIAVDDPLKLDLFDKLVEEFIKDYELEPAQIETARSILKEFKEKAEDYRSRIKPDLEKLVAERQDALKARDRKKKAELEGKIAELRKPVQELLAGLKARLDPMPTTAQREKYAARQAEKSGKPTPPVAKPPPPKADLAPTPPTGEPAKKEEASPPANDNAPKPGEAPVKPPKTDGRS